MVERLILEEDIFDQLDEGKRVTIRKGRRDIPLGKLIFESKVERRLKIVNVINVHYSRLSNVYIGDLNNDGFKDHFDMWEKMKRFYPDISFDDEVTTVKFSMKENG